jgi:hypothetical protein
MFSQRRETYSGDLWSVSETEMTDPASAGATNAVSVSSLHGRGSVPQAEKGGNPMKSAK